MSTGNAALKKGEKMTKMKDRRRESRVPYRATADMAFGKKNYQGLETRDISITGTYIEGLSGHKKGEKCSIDLALKGEASELLLKMKGEVVRIEDGGMGLEFIDVSRDCFYHLKNIAYVISVNPDDIICTNYKKPRASKIVLSDDFDDTLGGFDDEDD